jgi:hypothetical protein
VRGQFGIIVLGANGGGAGGLPRAKSQEGAELSEGPRVLVIKSAIISKARREFSRALPPGITGIEHNI